MIEFQVKDRGRFFFLTVLLLSLVTIMISLLSNDPVTYTVYAHANSVSYLPESDSIVGGDGNLPEEVVIEYTERPEPKASFIHVTNSNNERVDMNDYKLSANNPEAASVSLDSSELEPGIYTVSWLALSTHDGHITKGSYIFTIAATGNGSQNGVGEIPDNNFVDSVIVNNVNITYEINPFYSGTSNNFTLSLSDADGNAPSNIKTVFLIFNNEEAGIGPLSEELDKMGEGTYSESGGYLSQPGEWEIRIVVQRTDAYDLNHEFNISIIPPPPPAT